MRIALFTDTFLPKVDGIVTTLVQTVRQLKRMGHEVLIFSPDGGVTEYEQSRIVGMKSIPFPLYPELQLALPRARIRKLLAQFKPDLIHVVEPALLGTAGLYYGGGLHGGALGLPLVISYHTDLPKYVHYYKLSFMEPFVWSILRFRHNRATINLCTSHTIARELEEGGIKHVALWPGGVDVERFHPNRFSEEMRARLTEGHPESPLLLYAGRLGVEKGLESFKSILEAIPEARLALVGDGPHRKALERHFAGHKVYMPGFLLGDELAAAFATSDVFVMPSRTETLGLVVLEAMAAGRAVVGARAGGIPEMIDDGVSGFLFDATEEAIGQIRDLLASRERREEIGANARAEAMRRSWASATEVLVAHYRAACRQQEVNPRPAAVGLSAKCRYALRRSTMYAIRKLLP